MTYSVTALISSVAAMLSTQWPDVPVYGSPVQQATYPCFFIFLMPSEITDQIDHRDKRDISLDVVYVQRRDVPDAEAEIWGIADTLDELLGMVSYTDGTDTVPLHTHDRTYSIEDQELHYKLRIPARVSVPRSAVLMQVMEEEDIDVKD